MKYVNITNEIEDWPEWYLTGLNDFFQGEPREPKEYVYDEIFDSVLFPLQRKRELQKTLEIAMNKKPLVVGEIGADKGGSLYHWARLPGVRRVLAIELRGVPYREHFSKAFQEIDFCFVHGSSQDQKNISAIHSWLGEDSFDCLFLDGDKAGFFSDYQVYKEMMKPGGIMFLHDINGEPPQYAFEEIAQIERTEKIIDVSEALEFPELQHPRNSWEQWLKFWRDKSCGVGVVYL